MDMNHSFLNTISEAKLLEWRGVVKELMKASLTWIFYCATCVMLLPTYKEAYLLME
jgi:hypothetical protein